MKHLDILTVCLLLILIGCIFISGCTNTNLETLSDEGSENSQIIHYETINSGHEEVKNTSIESSGSIQLKKFIQETFPQLTQTYGKIKSSETALDQSKIQENALTLEQMVHEMISSYHLDQTLPEKNMFPGLSTTEKVVLNKYIGFIKDLGVYASTLKEAMYWKQSGSDQISLSNYRRNQDLAENYEKKVITDIKSLDEYCKEWDFTYFDNMYIGEYSFVS